MIDACWTCCIEFTLLLMVTSSESFTLAPRAVTTCGQNLTLKHDDFL